MYLLLPFLVLLHLARTSSILLNRSGERGHPCPRFFCKCSLSSKTPLFLVCWEFLSWVVGFCQMFFLCLLIWWLYDFSSDVIDYINWFKMLNHPCILGIKLLKLFFSDRMFKIQCLYSFTHFRHICISGGPCSPISLLLCKWNIC